LPKREDSIAEKITETAITVQALGG
jgi:hypothetical protein